MIRYWQSCNITWCGPHLLLSDRCVRRNDVRTFTFCSLQLLMYGIWFALQTCFCVDVCMGFGLHCKLGSLLREFRLGSGFLRVFYDLLFLCIDFNGISWWLHDLGIISVKFLMELVLIFMLLDSDTIPQDEFWGPESWILGPWVSKAPLGGAVEGFRWHFEGLCPAKVCENHGFLQFSKNITSTYCFFGHTQTSRKSSCGLHESSI